MKPKVRGNIEFKTKNDIKYQYKLINANTKWKSISPSVTPYRKVLLIIPILYESADDGRFMDMIIKLYFFNRAISINEMGICIVLY